MEQGSNGIFIFVATSCAVVVTSLAFILGTPESAGAQNRGSSGGGSVVIGPDQILPGGSGGVAFNQISNRATEQIVFLVSGVGAFCARLPDARYQVDCLADQYQQITQLMSRSGEYSGARAAIDTTAKRLRSLAEANRASDARPAQLADRNTRHGSSRPIVPVAKARTAAVKARAAQIIEEGRTILLRSAEQSQRRKVAYAQIAEALESNKVLLRSA